MHTVIDRVWLLLIVLLLQACGYTLNHRLRSEFSDPRGIAVPVFTNNTDEVGAERVFTNAVIRELQSRSNVAIRPADVARYILQGEVSTISYAPTALSATGFRGLQDWRRLPTDLVVTVTLTLRLVERSTGRVVWGYAPSSFRRIAAPAGMPLPASRTYDYEAPSSIGLRTQSLIEQTYPEIARDLARDMYDEMLDLF